MAWKPFVIPFSTGEADPAGMFGKVVRINGNRPVEKVADDIYRQFLRAHKN